MRRGLLLSMTMLAVVACGGGGTGTDSTTGESGSDGETLADFFGYGTEDPEAQEAQYREQEARIQESIRQCMAEAGFEYLPVMPPEGAFAVGGDWDEEEYVKTHGFGITTWYGNEELDQAMAEEWVDPNQETLEAMSESEATAWNEALYGTPEEQEASQIERTDPETGEVFPAEGPYQRPQTVRALYQAASALEKLEIRERKSAQLPAKTGEPWTEDEDRKLLAAFDAGHALGELAAAHQRTQTGIRARLVKYGRLAA